MMRDVVVLALCAGVMGCGPSVVGRACDSTDPCPNGFACAPAHDSTNRCMRECNLDETVCNDGTACLPLTGSVMGGACYLGGTVAVGRVCTNDLDCTRTAICLSSPLSGSTQCFVGCNLDGSHGCNGGLACQPTSGMTAGFCTGM